MGSVRSSVQHLEAATWLLKDRKGRLEAVALLFAEPSSFRGTGSPDRSHSFLPDSLGGFYMYGGVSFPCAWSPWAYVLSQVFCWDKLWMRRFPGRCNSLAGLHRRLTSEQRRPCGAT